MKFLKTLVLCIFVAAGVPSAGLAAFGLFQVAGQCLNFVAQGDSITTGATSTNPYPANIAAALVVTGSNQGVSSTGWNYDPGGGNLVDRAPTAVDPLLASLACGGGTKPFLIGFAGTNDLTPALGNSTPAQTYGYFQTWLSARISAGWPVGNILVPTVLSRADIPNATRVTYNNLLIAGAVTSGYRIVGTGEDANLGCNGCYANTTYFTDGIHPTNAGQQIDANLICLVMNPRVGTCPAYP